MPLNDPTFVQTRNLQRPIIPEATQQFYKEHSEGDRFGSSPNSLMRVAPYLPYIRFNADHKLHEVILGGTLVSRDSSGRIVPANGIPAAAHADYPGRPFEYSALDYNGLNGLINYNAAVGDPLVSGDLTADNILEAVSTVAGMESMGFAGVQAGRFPIGVLFETALEGLMEYKALNYDPQPQLTVITQYVLEFGEYAANQRNYADAVADAFAEMKAYAAGTTGALDPTAGTVPAWVGTAGGTDAIQPGDLVAIDDRGRLVRYCGDNTVLGAGSAEAGLPSVTLQAVVGRCFATEDVLSQGRLNMAATSPGMRVAGGSRPTTAYRGQQSHLLGANRRLLVKIETGA